MEVKNNFLISFYSIICRVSEITHNGLQLPEGRDFENEITLKI
jgi:hypothetical protein